MENHSNLYFIVIDSDDNVFGHYYGSTVNILSCARCSGIFLFVLNYKERAGLVKYNAKNMSDIFFTTYASFGNSDMFYIV